MEGFIGHLLSRPRALLPGCTKGWAKNQAREERHSRVPTADRTGSGSGSAQACRLAGLQASVHERKRGRHDAHTHSRHTTGAAVKIPTCTSVQQYSNMMRCLRYVQSASAAARQPLCRICEASVAPISRRCDSVGARSASLSVIGPPKGWGAGELLLRGWRPAAVPGL